MNIPIINDRQHAAHMMRIRHLIIFTAAFLTCGSLDAQFMGQGWKVLTSTASELVLEYRPVYRPPVEVRLDRQSYSLIDFTGSCSLPIRYEGYPDARYATMLIGVPSRNVSATVIAAEYTDTAGVMLPPVRVMDGSLDQNDGASTGALKPAVNQAAYSMSTPFPDTLASIVEVREVQHMLVANVVIRPVQYNAAAHGIRKYSRIVVQVNFGPQSVASVQQGVAPPIARSLLNRQVAQQWRTTRPVLAKAPSPGVLASGEWYRIEVKNTGVYKLDYTTLKNAGINVDQIDPRTIKIYNNSGRALPEDVAAPRPSDLVENAIRVTGEADGKFDTQDMVFFYGQSVNGWSYDSTKQTYRHYFNEWTGSNYYWLTYNGAPGKRFATELEASSTNPYRVPSITGKIYYEEEVSKIILNGEDGTGRHWYGPKLTHQVNTLTRRETLNDAIPGSPMRIRVNIGAHGDETTQMLVSQDGTLLGSMNFFPVGTYAWLYLPGPRDLNGVAPTGSAQTMIRFEYRSQSESSEAYLDWYELLYQRQIRAINDELPFDSPDTSAVVLYHLDGFSSNDIMVLDVSDYANVKIVQTHPGPLSGVDFQAQATAGGTIGYFAAAPAGYRTPVGIQKMTNSDLHGTDASADLLIIAHKDFWDAAQRLAAFHNSPGRGYVKSFVANVADIFNEFGTGQPDPVAIRDYVAYAYHNWSNPPKYVLLFGDGTYDYKNILGRGNMYIPPFETEESEHYIYSYCYDDFYVTIDPTSDSPTLPIGRITCRSLDEANVWVDKLIKYETNADYADWRNLIIFVADDGLTTEVQTVSQTEHTEESEVLATQVTPPQYDQKKIYLVEYPDVLSSSGRTKPDAAKDLITQWNRGALIVNWVGHGSPVYWAHEHVFDATKTIPQLINGDRLPLAVTATCDFGRYDALDQSGAEEIAEKADGGSIATLSTCRAVYGAYNAAFAFKLFTVMLGVTDSTGQVGRIGDAWIYAKQNPLDLVNNQKFHIIGDPTLVPLAPKLMVSLDSINTRPVSENVPTHIHALEKTVVKGHLNQPGGNSTPMQVSMAVHDGDKHVSIVDVLNGHFDYYKPGEIIFQGAVSAPNGRYTGTFIPPKDVSYSQNTGRISLYAENGGSDGVGFTNSIMIGAADSTTAIDTTGPQISMYLQTRNFRPGDLVAENPMLYVDLHDDNGINLSTASIGHGLDMWLDNSSQSVSLSEYYRSATDSYQNGTIEYQLQSLAPGGHTLKVRAWDTYNNSTTATTNFRVASSASFTVSDVMNYPNPFSSQTVFTFNQNQTDPVDVDIKIYTVAGRLIKTIMQSGVSGSFVRIPWDGTDADGSQIANGVYLYKVIVKTAGGDKSQEVLGKLAVLR